MTIELTDKQKLFCNNNLRQASSNTGIKGIRKYAYSPQSVGAYVVRDIEGNFIADFGNIDEAVAELLVTVYGFDSPKNESVDAIITYLGAERFLT